MACCELLPYTQDLLIEKFGAKRRAEASLSEEDRKAVEKWETFPFNTGGGLEAFPASKIV